MALLKNRKPAPTDGQMELVEHLGELRTRILRSVAYIAVGMVLTYNLFHVLYTLLEFPLAPIIRKTGGLLVFHGIADAFVLRMQVCLISGLAVAFPFVTLELWGFIEPALTPDERKPVTYLAPFSILLFLAGIATGYACLPTCFGWMASYIVDVPDATLMQQAQQYIVLTVKIMLAFGIAFQLPLILLFLARIGLITAELMTTYWRHATVGIAVVAAVLTPSNDPLTMLMMAIPMAGLYLLSIGLVRAFEPREDGTRKVSIGPMLLIALAPVAILLAVGFWLFKSGITQNTNGFADAPRGINRTATPVPVPAPTPDPRVMTQAAQIEELRHEIETLNTRLDELTKSQAATPAPAPSASPFVQPPAEPDAHP